MNHRTVAANDATTATLANARANRSLHTPPRCRRHNTVQVEQSPPEPPHGRCSRRRHVTAHRPQPVAGVAANAVDPKKPREPLHDAGRPRKEPPPPLHRLWPATPPRPTTHATRAPPPPAPNAPRPEEVDPAVQGTDPAAERRSRPPPPWKVSNQERAREREGEDAGEGGAPPPPSLQPHGLPAAAQAAARRAGARPGGARAGSARAAPGERRGRASVLVCSYFCTCWWFLFFFHTT